MALSTLSFSSHNKSPLFKQSIEKLFNNWTALQIAVENGQGGLHGKEISVWMREALENFFYENDDLMGDEVAEFLGTIMDQEFETIVDDNSLEDLGAQLCQHFYLAMNGKETELLELHKGADAAASLPKPNVQFQNDAGNMDEESSESEHEMEIDQNQIAHSHRTGSNLVTEPDEDGWMTVVKSKKR